MLTATRRRRIDVRRDYRSGTKVVPTTDSGWATYSAGSRLFLPAATNYATNPSFETDSNADGLADGWSNWSDDTTGDATYTRVTGITGRGGYAQRIQQTASAGDSAKYFEFASDLSGVGTIAAGDILTISATVLCTKTGTGTLQMFPVWRLASGNANGSGAAISFGTIATPTRISVTTAAAPANTSQIRLLFQYFSWDEGDAIDLTIDDVLIEKSAVLCPYFDGSYANCAWTGTAHASTSTRTGSQVTLTSGLPAGLIDAGTIAFRLVPLYALNDAVAHNWSPALVFANGYVQSMKGSANTVIGRLNDGANHNTSGVAVTGAAGTQAVVVVRYANAATVDCNTNGTNSTQAAAAASLGALSALYLPGNCYLTGVTVADPVYLGPVIISPTRKSDAWVAAIQANSGAAYDNLNTLWNSFMSKGDLLLPLKGDGWGWVKT